MNKMITAFSWMLIHSLWQGLLLAIIGGAGLMFTKKSGAVRRYNLVLILFVAFIGVCIYTFIIEWNNAPSKTIAPLLRGNIGANVSLLFENYNIQQLYKTFTDYFSANAPLVVLFWLIVFLFKSVKMIACMVYNHRVKNVEIYATDRFWADTVAGFSEKLLIKKTVKLVQSGYIKMPVVVGHLKPVILIPLGLIGGLPAEQVEAILLHELAHISRNDYFVNFLQNIAETIFFFNPGLLWISSLLREERENCCDDIALAQTQNKRGFVQALISFREHELYGTRYATAFPGKKNYLMRRVSRIMGNENKAFGFGEKIFFTMSVVLLALIIGTVAFGQISFQRGVNMMNNRNKTAHDSIPTDSISANKDALKTVAPLKHTNVRYSAKMRNGISGIKRQRARLPYSRAGEPIKPVAVSAKIESASMGQLREFEARDSKENPMPTDKERADLDEKQSNARKAGTPKLQVEQDQIQAVKDQERARLDQEQVVRDQVEALKDQAQARLNQLQAMKDRVQAKSYRQQAIKEKTEAIRPKISVN